MRNTHKPQWVRELATSSPCIVYSANATRIVSGERDTEGKFVSVTKVLPPTFACDPANLPGRAPHSRSGHVLRGAGGEGFCPGEVEPLELHVPRATPRNVAQRRGTALTVAEQVLAVLEGRQGCC